MIQMISKDVSQNGGDEPPSRKPGLSSRGKWWFLPSKCWCVPWGIPKKIVPEAHLRTSASVVKNKKKHGIFWVFTRLSWHPPRIFSWGCWIYSARGKYPIEKYTPFRMSQLRLLFIRLHKSCFPHGKNFGKFKGKPWESQSFSPVIFPHFHPRFPTSRTSVNVFVAPGAVTSRSFFEDEMDISSCAWFHDFHGIHFKART